MALNLTAIVLVGLLLFLQTDVLSYVHMKWFRRLSNNNYSRSFHCSLSKNRLSLESLVQVHSITNIIYPVVLIAIDLELIMSLLHGDFRDKSCIKHAVQSKTWGLPFDKRDCE